ncbi:hypothetical protein DMENIID0001_091050 [Sergentomyia squamirostris]
MRSDLDIYPLKHRIFLVKHFYQAMGDYMSVKNKYEKYYSDGEDDPEFSNDALVEVVNLFEKTGSVLKQTAGEASEVNNYNQIEQVYLRESTVDGLDNVPIQLKAENTEDDSMMDMSDDIPTEDPEYLDEDSASESGRVLGSTVEGTDVHGCELCGKVFTGIQSFQKHQLTHANETQFKCNVRNCQKTFKQWASYKAHKLTHSEPTTSTAASGNPIASTSRDSPQTSQHKPERKKPVTRKIKFSENSSLGFSNYPDMTNVTTSVTTSGQPVFTTYDYVEVITSIKVLEALVKQIGKTQQRVLQQQTDILKSIESGNANYIDEDIKTNRLLERLLGSNVDEVQAAFVRAENTFQLPISTESDFEELERTLSSKKSRCAFVTQLSRKINTNGKDQHRVSLAVANEILLPSVQILYSWKGTKEKREFKSKINFLEAFTILMNSVYKDFTASDTENLFKEHVLRHANARNNRFLLRQSRQGNNEQSEDEDSSVTET